MAALLQPKPLFQFGHIGYRFEAYVDISLTAGQIFKILSPSPEKWIFVILNKRAKIMCLTANFSRKKWKFKNPFGN